MSLILSIDTSTKVCSVAIHENGVLLALEDIFIEKSHSENITLIIEHLLFTLQKTYKDLAAVAISKGPGSYTGLRIGVSTAKGLCYGLSIPLIAINSLEAMSLQVRDFCSDTDLICPMIDARRLEVFCGIWNKKGECILSTNALVLDVTSFEAYFSSKVYFIGNSNDKCKIIVTHPNAIYISDIHPSAKTVGYLAWEAFQKKQFEDVAYFEPYYLKEFMTTAKIVKQ